MPWRKFAENLGPNLFATAIVTAMSTGLTVLIATKLTMYRVEQLEEARISDRAQWAAGREADRVEFKAIIEKLDVRITRFEDNVSSWKEQNAKALTQISSDVSYIRGRLEERKQTP